MRALLPIIFLMASCTIVEPTANTSPTQNSVSSRSPQQVVQAQNIGGSIGARAYSQSHELEADILGVYVAEIAGYNPEVGARSFARFSGGGGFLSTHPPSAQRIQAVQRTIQRIEQDRAAGRNITVP